VNTTNELVRSLQETWGQILEVLPRIALGLLLLLIGWMLARLLRKGAMRVFRLLQVDRLAEKAGLEDFLIQGGVRFTTVTLLGGLVYWLVLFATFVALLDVLGLPAGEELMGRVVHFLPNVVLAVVILMFGTMLSRFVGSLSFTYLNNVGSSAAAPISALARYAVLIFVMAMAAEQLALRSEILVSGFQIAFGALCLALALAFGLGGREWAARLLDKHMGGK
jgi:small-conductance mechanosensitive channel